MLVPPQPMFFMTNDGGTAQKKSTMHNASVLVQRMLILKLLFRQGISVTLLKGAEFVDAKVLVVGGAVFFVPPLIGLHTDLRIYS
jgi:hypothetical protein